VYTSDVGTINTTNESETMNNEFKTVNVISGSYEGKTGWVKKSDKPRGGRVCVMFPGVNMRGAFIEVKNLKDSQE
jgi:hypothetical protein